jgi:hypothetical protein
MRVLECSDSRRVASWRSLRRGLVVDGVHHRIEELALLSRSDSLPFRPRLAEGVFLDGEYLSAPWVLLLLDPLEQAVVHSIDGEANALEVARAVRGLAPPGQHIQEALTVLAELGRHGLLNLEPR